MCWKAVSGLLNYFDNLIINIHKKKSFLSKEGQCKARRDADKSKRRNYFVSGFQ